MRVLLQIHATLLTRPLPTSVLSFALSKVVAFAALRPRGDYFYAKKVFSHTQDPNIFAWNSLIRGSFLSQSPSREPIFIFKKLVNRGLPKANTFTLAFVLKACSLISAFLEGQQVHKKLIQSGFSWSPFVRSSLVDFYAKCGEVSLAKKVFDENSERNVVTWSTMISGYCKVGMVNEALGVFREMQKSDVAPDEVTMVSVISACAVSGALDMGRWAHAYINKELVENGVEISTALVNMYAKCGCIEKAIEIFDAMPVKDTKAWSTMIVGLAIHGLAEEALRVFSMMEDAKVEPSHITFVGVLSACAHGGLVSDGRKYWSRMREYGIEPSREHYGSMVNLFSRASLIEEAQHFVETMPISPDPVIWRTLIAACRRSKDLDRGEICAQRLLELEPHKAENYVLLSNLYATGAQWAKMSCVRKQMTDKGFKAIPGCSSIEVNGFVHEFVMGDLGHPEAKEIREVLREVSNRVRNTGHEPWVSAVLHNVGDEEKGDALYEHSERLAIAFGLLKTQAPVVIRVVKNLRACEDCHEVINIISRLYDREIIVRDRVRFHKFVNGACSCGDFW